ncbi:hypothetical protein IMZ29_00710 [Achromobacter sp. GG226]|uniref:phage head spike fiber domain-containing protein n=1 Tax=Verticiella alkaliphila TaxID=2779529 RepID=UPI001C0D99E5|nr:hypothetical protein [Verticiella sp. GG226]MBU4609123.1 hypothetical protein [Verticiella sp. GG226]
MILPNTPRPTLEPRAITALLRATPPVSPPPGPWALDLDFRRDELDPRLQITAPGPKSYWDADGILRVAPPGTWPIEWDPVTRERRGRSVWEAQTNSYIRSSTIFTGNAGFLGVAGESGWDDPMGGAQAQLITETLANSEHFANDRYINLTQGATYTFSCYARLPEGVPASRLMLRIAAGSNQGWGALDLADGRTWTTGGVSSATYKALGGGLVRFWVTFTAAASALTNIRVQLTDEANRTSYPGRGAGLILFGGQFVTGSVPGPYIPTEGAAVTRPAESVVLTRGDWFDLRQGTWIVEYRGSSLGTSQRSFALGTSQSGEFLEVVAKRATSAIGRHLTVVSGGTTIDVGVGLPVASNDLVRMSFAYSEVSGGLADYAVSVNGAVAQERSAAAVARDAQQFCFGTGRSGGVHLNNVIQRVRYAPRRLSNAELQSLSSA